MDINESLEAFRGLPQFPEIANLLREQLTLPVDYADQEQRGALAAPQQQALIVYRLLTQEPL